MKFDDASWHYGGEFPESSPEEYGGTHIGLFLKWCFVQGWAGEIHLESERDSIQAVIEGNMSGTDFLFTFCDGKFTDEDLNEKGVAFATRYYGDHGLYLDDYARCFGDLMYIAPEIEHNFMTFSNMLKNRLSTDILTTTDQSSSKPWWKFW